MVFSGIRTHDQDDIRIADIDPVIGHRAASEGGRQTGNRCGVSNSGLVFYIDQSPTSQQLLKEVALFVIKRCTAD